MPQRRGYRSERLRRRRRSRIERSQAWLLYLAAAVVAFAAVLGAWYVAGRLGTREQPAKKGYLAAVQLTAPGQDQPVGALLVVQDPAGGDPGVYLVPPDALLEGPDGEYVFAVDAMAQGVLAQDLARVVHVPIDVVYTIPVSDLGTWAGSDELKVEIEKPVVVEIDGGARTIEDGDLVPSADLPAIFAELGSDRRGVTDLQVSLVQAALDAAALRTAADRAGLAGVSPSPTASPALSKVVSRITSGKATVERLPTTSRVAEGQFAWVPDPEPIMASITRRSPAYHADVTVQVRNGSGRIGVGQAVVERLASLDVDLPAPLNADSFTYQQTQILAGPGTLTVARDIRVILGRGVVLEGNDLPKGIIRVIVGGDFQTPQASPTQP